MTRDDFIKTWIDPACDPEAGAVRDLDALLEAERARERQRIRAIFLRRAEGRDERFCILTLTDAIAAVDDLTGGFDA
jgi:hypothetical protein